MSSSFSSPSPRHTGRPAKWTSSHQRKLARLYVYTTLPLAKILDVVYHSSPTDPPGKESASKKLNSLLDSQPRWLHPRNLDDMGRRLQQLALSPPTRTSSSSSSTQTTRNRATSDPVLSTFSSARFHQQQQSFLASSSLPLPPSYISPWTAPSTPASTPSTFMPWQQQPQSPTVNTRQANESELFAPFLRRTSTANSSCTMASSFSLSSLLPEYSQPYREVVKGLVRCFTRPLVHHVITAPISETNSFLTGCPNDDDDDDDVYNHVLLGSYTCRPFLLPGHFLYLDSHVGCPQGHEHTCRQCLCSAADDLIRSPSAWSPWLTPAGLTECGLRIITFGPLPSDWSQVDVFGNTLLHFVAARGTIDLLLLMVNNNTQAPPILHQLNSAGQTFLHVMSPYAMAQVNAVQSLVGMLARAHVDIFAARDHYGRNFFHMLRVNGVSQSALDQILTPFQSTHWNCRDAFGHVPRPVRPRMMPTSESTSRTHVPSTLSPASTTTVRLSAHAIALESVNYAISQDAFSEDAHGRNGLHCLAAVNLSLATAPTAASSADSCVVASAIPSSSAASPPLPAPAGHKRRAAHGDDKKLSSDSSKGLLELRRRRLEDLLAAGVEINAYDASGHTPLMAFAAQLPEDGDHKLGPVMLSLLMDHGANVDARNRAGETALHIAVRAGRKLAVRALVEGGANVHARDARGRSVLDVADAEIMAAATMTTTMTATVAGDDCPRAYARWEACRAWLSGHGGQAVQNPGTLDEWAMR